ncbi:hypothetical protein EA462_16010 [Natrarchaeobius halalkaliphilus]|uniref:Uncharacterized protein n=1 Tax=Natrarchaeobius halalkaliphilus TaxID=1679091 RepID=A0A3N6LXA0_9EURY|nr:hypothetical protein EA462_16010 [Natrarchaeobius halalkaliphilus]
MIVQFRRLSEQRAPDTSPVLGRTSRVVQIDGERLRARTRTPARAAPMKQSMETLELWHFR